MSKSMSTPGFSFVVVLILALAGCAGSGQMSTMQKRHIESRTLEGSYENVFRATLTVLQDEAYVVRNADMATGFINAQKNIRKGVNVLQALLGALAVGLGGPKDPDSGPSTMTFEVSFTFEKLDSLNTYLRFSAQKIEYGPNGQAKNIEPYTKPDVLNSLFNSINVEIKRRELMR